jgi:hypothetical protein
MPARKTHTYCHSYTCTNKNCKLYGTTMYSICSKLTDSDTRNRPIADTNWRSTRKQKHSSTILNLGTTWRWAVSFMPLLLYTPGNSPWYSFHRKLGGPHRRSGFYEEKNLWPPSEIEHQFLGRPARSFFVIPTELSRLLLWQWITCPST